MFSHIIQTQYCVTLAHFCGIRLELENKHFLMYFIILRPIEVIYCISTVKNTDS
jgi:hypothetical protein